MKKILSFIFALLFFVASYSQDTKHANVSKRISGTDTLTFVVDSAGLSVIKSTNPLFIHDIDSVKFSDGSVQYSAATLPSTLTWLDPVISIHAFATCNAGADGYRYIASSTGSGWTKDYIYECDGSSWSETIPVAGNAVVINDSSAIFIYSGSAWVKTSSPATYWAASGSHITNINIGSVGIGTVPSSTTYKLDVLGYTRSSKFYVRGSNFAIDSDADENKIRSFDASRRLSFYTNNTERFGITAAGRLYQTALTDPAKFLYASVTGVIRDTSIVIPSDSLVQVIVVNGWLSGSRIKETKCWDIDVAPTLIDSGYVTVYRGYYVADGNLAKNNVIWEFKEGANVLKTTIGAIFDYSGVGYTKPVYILGKGNFTKTTNTGQIITLGAGTSTITNVIFHFDVINNALSDGIYLYDDNLISMEVVGNKITSGGGDAISYSGNGIIDVNYITSTFRYGVYYYAYQNYYTTINSNYVSGATYGVRITRPASIMICSVVCNIAYCTSYYSSNGNIGYQLQTTINGDAGTIENYGKMGLNGYVYDLYNSAATAVFTGGKCGQITCSAGCLITSKTADGWNKPITISGGLATITLLYNGGGFASNITVSGGTLRLNGNYDIGYDYFGQMTINGGTLIIECPIDYCSFGYILSGKLIVQSSGTVIIRDKIRLNTYAAYDSPIIKKTGGILILDNATLVKTNIYQMFIEATSSAQDIKIYSGGCTTNGTTGDLLSAKARKDSLIVSAVATTTIVLNDGSGGDETFTEADVVTYDTQAKLAQRMAALINASGTLDITATYVSGATFNIESDVAGTNYTQSGLVNLTNTQLRLNSYAITDLTGGTLIEDSDVTY